MGRLQIGACPERVLGCVFLGPAAGVLAEVYLAGYLYSALNLFTVSAETFGHNRSIP